jgi:hypothetical protein
MQALLNAKTPLKIIRQCTRCNNTTKQVLHCMRTDYAESDYAVIEHGFFYNRARRSADVALLGAATEAPIKLIVEICHRHKTTEANRPEPWIEVDAEAILHAANAFTWNDTDSLCVQCIRDYTCVCCCTN